MSNMREAFPEPGELLVIPLERALPAVMPKRKDPEPIGKKRNRAARGLLAALAASLLLNAVQAVIIYVQQAGPI